MPAKFPSCTAAEPTGRWPRRGDTPAFSPATRATARAARRDARHAPDAERARLPTGIARGHWHARPGQSAGADPTHRAALALPAEGYWAKTER